MSSQGNKSADRSSYIINRKTYGTCMKIKHASMLTLVVSGVRACDGAAVGLLVGRRRRGVLG